MSTNRSNGFAFLGGSAPYLPLPLVVGYFQAFCQQKQKVYQVSARTVTEMEPLWPSQICFMQLLGALSFRKATNCFLSRMLHHQARGVAGRNI